MTSEVPLVEKKYTLAYFNKYSYGLVPSDLDDEELDGKYFVEKTSLDELHETLLQNFGLTKTLFTAESVRNYIDSLNENYSYLVRY